MSSKYIPKKGSGNTTYKKFNRKIGLVSESGETWSNYIGDITPEERKQIKQDREDALAVSKFIISEKKRIESIKLEELSFTDLYEFPFKLPSYSGYGSQVYDNKDNFIFQFESGLNKSFRPLLMNMINGESSGKIEDKIYAKDDEIFMLEDGVEKHIITIRGWGNLTGIGSYNLESKYAAKIQDSLIEFIVEKLSV